MTEEFKLRADVAKALQAQHLLENELLIGSFKQLEETYTAAWRASHIEDVGAREKLFLAINIVGKVRDHLTAVVSNGKLAERELRDLVDTAERQKRFGTLA